jgi:hypothetical protein
MGILREILAKEMAPEEYCSLGPWKCEGDGAGMNCSDDPCWSCIQSAFWTLGKIKEVLENT